MRVIRLFFPHMDLGCLLWLTAVDDHEAMTVRAAR
jgi:hypothetical protein